MLTIKQITDNTEAVIRGLEKKHFKNAQETIEQVLAFNDKRKSTQNVLDKNLAEVNAISKSIGMLMKEGKKDEAEAAKARVAEIKEANKTLQAEMDQAQEDLNNLLYTIPNIPYDEVPEGKTAEDNVVEKTGGMETCTGNLHTEVEVNQVVFLRQVPMRKCIFWKLSFHTTGLFYHIVFSSLAFRNFIVRNVRDGVE